MPPDPLVSVVIPTRNRATLLRMALGSVLGQENAPPTEVIVVDDASTDETADVLSTYGDRIRVLRNDRRAERGAARNRGAATARGQLLAFLDDDDEWKPTKLARQVRLVEPGRACGTGIERVDVTGAVVAPPVIPPQPTRSSIVLRNQVPTSTLLVCAEDFHALGGFPEQRSVAEDWLFLARLICSGRELAVVQEPLVRYRVHPGSSGSDLEWVALSMWSAVEWMDRDGLVRGPELERVRARVAGMIARRCANAGDFGLAREWTLRSFRRGPASEASVRLALTLASGFRGQIRRFTSTAATRRGTGPRVLEE